MVSIPLNFSAPPVSEADVLKAAADIGYTIPENELNDYKILLEKARVALQTIADMDDYQISTKFTLAPRKDVKFSDPQDNPLNAWAYKCTINHTRPQTALLSGRSICLKDNIALAGVPCLLGTSTFTDWIPRIDATVASRILEASGTISGKAVCENLSRGAVSCTAATGPVHNPYARNYSAGGSSSGTAALVGSGACDMGIGCDQGGSIRIPAALCGCVGLKPTMGLVPYTGIVSNCASVDYVGPITKSVMDCAMLLEAISGVDGEDDRQIAGVPFLDEVPSYSTILEETKKDGVKGMKIGVLKEGLEGPIIDERVAERFHAAVKVFEELGATVEEVSVPIHEKAGTIYSVLSKMGNQLGMLNKATGRTQVMLTDLYEKKSLPYTKEALEKMSTMSLDGLLVGSYAWSTFPLSYPKSVNIGRKLRDSYNSVLSSYDIIIMPTTKTPSDPLPAPDATPLEHIQASRGKTENTAGFNISGHPALAFPIGFVKSAWDENVSVPASAQIVGKYWEESKLLRAAYAWESAIDWRTIGV